ncbi:hypothetical protein NBRC10512_002325 [Rhodotorula toruloides]|uniref:RHTO0S08e05666g1_1 n=2 Tax=Rhodotorula toruloides TaxID=5286 RepID=A0A061B7E1_RHOTO|nr:homeodomain transcription factor HD1 [Rhodotorula toruloides NP11]EMS22255.1 homeodomain transcription factor HD1 [Rhodotorula toruloides NP11]CDR43788.1 RHTO0S08e05666g1_1 [Rhodotorula toruloides]
MSTCSYTLLHDLRAFERTYLAALRDATVDGILVKDWCALLGRIQKAFKLGELSSDAIAVVQGVVCRVRIVAEGMANLQASCDTTIIDMVRQAKSTLDSTKDGYESGPGLDAKSLSRDADSFDSLDDPTTFTPYRQWFLDHFSNPYPSSKDKDALLEQVTVHTRRQLDTWYTNQRRRSGWHALKRKYGRISTLLKRIDEAGQDDEEMQQAMKEVECVRAYFKNDRQDHVRDEIREIISQGRPTTSTKRRIESGPARRVGGKMARPQAHFLDNPPSTPAPLMPGSWTPYPVGQDEDVFAPTPTTRLELAPRLPFDFSSPDSSRRTFSGSSSSSTDSLISYDPLDLPVSKTGPGSPPASSSLLNFDGRSTFVHSSPARASRHSPRRGSFVVRNSVYPTRPHPYFCTVNELPTGSSLARFASS